jgi:hypothetical protein
LLGGRIDSAPVSLVTGNKAQIADEGAVESAPLPITAAAR